MPLNRDYPFAEIIRIPVDGILVINKGLGGDEQAIKITKKLDDESMNFGFYNMKSRTNHVVSWSRLRSDYIDLGFVRVGNAVWFNADSHPLIKWEPTELMGPRAVDWVWYWEWVEGDTSNITTTFKDIQIIK